MQTPEPIIIEQTYHEPVSRLWQALTDKDQMKEWYFELADFKPEPGFEFTFEGNDGEKTFLHLCRVTVAIPEQKLAYSWRYQGFEGNSLVIFELFPEGEKTHLKLTHEGLETFPADIPSFARKNFVAGWTEITGSLLKNFLEKPAVTKL